VSLLSFIVPAHNEQQLLGRTLAGLHTAAMAVGVPYDIVVADDSSTDDTASIAAHHGATVVHVRHRQIAAARNAGAAAARSDRLIFVDADTIVPEETLRATLAAWNGGAIGGGASVHLDGRLPLSARFGMPVFRAGMRAARLAAGCYVFSTREAFDAVGGFDTRLFAGEELAFSRSLWRQGRFIVLREPVVSSGRKLRTHSAWEVAKLFLAAARGPALVRSRRHLDLWYGERRHDPDATG
jgi:cellulose synthase/poly-beta-1,6-N-acetylglucosamine synthase-like glycosyltransferase